MAREIYSVPGTVPNAERFGYAVVPPLSARNTAAENARLLSSAVDTANEADGYVELPAGRYPINCTLTTGCTIVFRPTTVLLQNENEAALTIDLRSDAVGPFVVQAFSYAKHTNDAGASTNKFMRIAASIAESLNFEVGDTVMVCSRDARTYYTGNTNYAGESAVVAAVDHSAGYVYLDGTLYLYGVGTLYTTNPVIYRLSRQKVVLVGPQVEADGDVYQTGLTGSWPGAIQLTALARPVVKGLRINSAWGIGLYLRSCANFQIDVDWVRDCPGDPANSRYGYGILARGACSNGIVSGGVFERTRHAVTTDCREAASWNVANVWDHGDCTDLTFSGITSVGNGAPPFDTHENSINTTFVRCRAIGARYTPLGITGANAYGFNLRGPWDKVIDCQADDCEGGVSIAATGIVHEIVGENIIDGFMYVGEALNNLAGYGISIDGNASETTPQRVAIRNLRPSRGSRGVLISSNYTGRVSFEHCMFRGWIDTQLRIQGSCTVDMVNCFIDMNEAGTGELCISIDNSNTVALNLIGVTIRSKNGTTPTNVVTTASGATCALRYNTVVDIAGNIAATAIEGGAGTYSPTPVNISALTHA